MLRATALSITLLSAACLAPAPDAGDLESLGGALDGFYFERPIDVTKGISPSETQLDGHFSTAWYAAYRFRAEQGKAVDMLTWADASWSDWWNDARLVQLLFVWAPVGGSTDVNDPDNWSLVRKDGGETWDDQDGGCWNCFGADQRTRFTPTATTDYLLLILTDEAHYTSGRGHHTVIDYAGTAEGKPGSISVAVTYSSGAPATGVRVAIGGTAQETDARGHAKFPGLLPNIYTVKLGPNGWEQQLDVWLLSGRSETRNVVLDHPL